MKLNYNLLKRVGVRGATLLLLVSGAFGACAAAPGSKAEAGPASNGPELAKSVFIDDPRTGRDPFFPNSVRRNPKRTPPPPTPGATAPQPVQLTLRAILVGQTKRLAQINNRILEVGEEGEVLVGSQKAKIRCVEIRDQSVLVNIDGANETKELFLRQR